MVSCVRSSSTVLTTFSRMSGVSVRVQVDAGGVLGREHDGVQPHRAWCRRTATVTWVLPSGRR